MEEDVMKSLKVFMVEHGLTELSLDMMDQISGGVMTEKGAKVLDALMKALKQNNRSIDDALDFVMTSESIEGPLFEGTTREEAADYVRSTWDTL